MAERLTHTDSNGYIYFVIDGEKVTIEDTDVLKVAQKLKMYEDAEEQINFKKESIWHYGDESMDFLDAVLILKNRGAVEEAEKHLAPDIALAIKTIVEGLDKETQKARNAGYTRGYLAAEKEKEDLIEKMASSFLSKEEQLDKIKSLLNAHTDFSRETPEVNYELLVAMFRMLNLERDEERNNELEM